MLLRQQCGKGEDREAAAGGRDAAVRQPTPRFTSGTFPDQRPLGLPYPGWHWRSRPVLRASVLVHRLTLSYLYLAPLPPQDGHRRAVVRTAGGCQIPPLHRSLPFLPMRLADIPPSLSPWRERAPTTGHLHGRGQKTVPAQRSLAVSRSSPQAWGKGHSGRRRGRQGRIIPTGVGKGRRLRPNRRGTPDHPHGRGEKRAIRTRTRAGIGSSPRAWGKGLSHARPDSPRRIIPTGVGKRLTAGIY